MALNISIARPSVLMRQSSVMGISSQEQLAQNLLSLETLSLINEDVIKEIDLVLGNKPVINSMPDYNMMIGMA